MAYVFRPKRLAREARHVVARQLEGVLAALESRPIKTAAIHDARTRIKKVRALIKLLGAGLGRHYESENRRLREAGRRLARLRDTDAIPLALAALRQRHPGMRPSDIHATTRGLVIERRLAWARVLPVVAVAT